MILIGLGANLPSPAGEPVATLRAALATLTESVEILGVSPFYATAAWPKPDDPPFVNAVAAIATVMEPQVLMQRLHAVEAAYGRVRAAKNAPRTLDLDLLDYHGRIQQGPPALPHPRIADRVFVLVPLHDVAPEWRHPESGRSAADLIAALPAAARKIAVLSR